MWRAYKIANFNYNNDNPFIPSPIEKEEDILQRDLYEILRRCYDLSRNNFVAQSAIRVMCSYVGQQGFRFDTDIQAQKDYVLDWQKNCMVSGADWETYRRQRITELCAGGGVLHLFTRKKDIKKGSALRIDLVQSGRVCTPPKHSGDKNVKNGIRYNSVGEEVGFYYKNGDGYRYVKKYNDLGMLNAYFERIPEIDRVSSGRPLPLFSAGIQHIEAIDKIAFYMQNLARNASSLGVVLETPSPKDSFAGMGLVNEDGTYKTDEILGQTRILGETKPDFIKLAPVGTKVHVVTPQSQTEFDKFFKTCQKFASASMGIIEELLFEDIDGKNFASSKFKAQSFVKKIKSWGRSLNNFETEIVRYLWQEANVLYSAGFNVNAVVKWGGEADFDDVDALKSANSAKVRIESGISTESEETARRGGDWSENLKIQKKEFDSIKEIAGEDYAEFQAYRKNINVGVSVSRTQEEADEIERNLTA